MQLQLLPDSLGLLVAIFGLDRGGLANIIQGIVQIIIGFWTNKAASAFKADCDYSRQ